MINEKIFADYLTSIVVTFLSATWVLAIFEIFHSNCPMWVKWFVLATVSFFFIVRIARRIKPTGY